MYYFIAFLPEPEKNQIPILNIVSIYHITTADSEDHLWACVCVFSPIYIFGDPVEIVYLYIVFVYLFGKKNETKFQLHMWIDFNSIITHAASKQQ